MIRTKSINEEVAVADQRIVHLGKADLEFMKSRVHQNARKRTRLCAHKTIEDKLHEMFVVYVRETYVRPNKHIGKDESLHIIQGSADFIFFDELGNATDVVELGDYASGRQFYCRIPESVYHTLIIKSELIVIHESTPGPFNRADTIFAPWAPEEQDSDGVRKYSEKLIQIASNIELKR
jgi:cupin fold WbuC family metalloprotein